MRVKASIHAALAALIVGSCLVVASAPADAATTETSFAYDSEPGDWVGQGGAEVFTVPPATMVVTGSLGFVNVNVSQDWFISLSAPPGEVLLPGFYADGAVSVSGDGHGCSYSFGAFII